MYLMCVFRTRKYRNMRVRYSEKCWSRRRPSCRYDPAVTFYVESASIIHKTAVDIVPQNLLEERLKNPSPSLEECIERAKRRAHQVRVKIQQDLVKRSTCFELLWCIRPPDEGTKLLFIFFLQEGARSDLVSSYVIAGNILLFLCIFPPMVSSELTLKELLSLITQPLFARNHTEIFLQRAA